jgi:hypothetical protein
VIVSPPALDPKAGEIAVIIEVAEWLYVTAFEIVMSVVGALITTLHCLLTPFVTLAVE